MSHPRIHLIHWNPGEVAERVERLRAAGFEALHTGPGPTYHAELAADPPAAVVIDLGRLPSQGRDAAFFIRSRKASAAIPVVFVGGAPEKVEAVRAVVPNAVFTEWEAIGEAVREAIASQPQAPAEPVSVFGGYAGRPVAQKLGIKAGSLVGVLDPPDDLAALLGELPDGATVRPLTDAPCDLTLWFVRTEAELRERIAAMAAVRNQGPLWVVRPKKGAARHAVLNEQTVRDAGLAEGIVDYKVCSFGEGWAGLVFSRKKVRPKAHVE